MTCSVPSTPCRRDARRDVLPAVQKAHVLGGGDRLDLAPQRPEREAVDARQHAAVAPLVGAAAAEPAAQHLTLGFEPQQRASRPSPRSTPKRSASAATRDRAARFEPAAQDLGERLVRLLRERLRGGTAAISGAIVAAGYASARQVEPFGAGPEARVAERERRRAALLRPARRTTRPLGDRRQHDQRGERVVQFVGVAHDRPHRFGHLGDRRRIEDPGAGFGIAANRAAQRHRARAALFERRVVEVGVRVRVEDLVTERRRLGRVDGDGRDRAALDRAAARRSARRRPSLRADSCRSSRAPARDRGCGSVR